MDRHRRAPALLPSCRSDEWRDAAELLRAHIAVVDAAIRHLDGELQRAQAETRRADEALRRVSDALDAPFGDATRRERELWRRDLADLQLRVAGAGASLTQIARDAKVEDLAARQAELRRLERQIAAGMQHMRFDASDLAQAQRRLKDAVTALNQDRNRLTRQLQERSRQRDTAARAVERTVEGTPERTTAQAKLRVAQDWVDTLRNENEIVAGMPRLARAWRRCGSSATCSSPPTIRRNGARRTSAFGRQSIRYRRGASTWTYWWARPGPNCEPRKRSWCSPTPASLPARRSRGDAGRPLHGSRL